MCDAETLAPAMLALQRQQQGGLLMVSAGCSRLYMAADWGRNLPSLLCCSSSPCHETVVLALISTGLQFMEAERGGSGYLQFMLLLLS